MLFEHMQSKVGPRVLGLARVADTDHSRLMAAPGSQVRAEHEWRTLQA